MISALPSWTKNCLHLLLLTSSSTRIRALVVNQNLSSSRARIMASSVHTQRSSMASSATSSEQGGRSILSTLSGKTQQGTGFHSARVELFFSSLPQLRERVQLCKKHGFYKFNLVNKNAKDDLLEWARVIQEEYSTPGDADTPTQAQCANICAHYSLKYNKVSRQGNDAHIGLLYEFCQQAESTQATSADVPAVTEILLVTGGHSQSKARPRWNTVEALRHMKTASGDDTTYQNIPKIAVAYNPYIPDKDQQKEEDERLEAKLRTGRVSKVYLQFGNDLVRLEGALQRLSSLSIPGSSTKLELAGSLFLPTKQLIAQQKFRPWNGVFLSAEFLSDPEAAQRIVEKMVGLYLRYQVEPLWEAPGIRTPKDFKLVQGIITNVEKDSGNADSHHIKDHDHDSSKEAAPSDDKPSFSPLPKRQKTLSYNSETTDECCIVLFGSHDLRLYDNIAVHEACQKYGTILPVFMWSPLLIESGGVSAKALEVLIKEAAWSLKKSLKTFNLDLVCLNCPSDKDQELAIANLIKTTSASALYYNRDYTPHGRRLEHTREKLIKGKFPHVQHVAQQSVLLYDIDQVSLTKGFHGGHWGTLMPFYKNCQKNYGQPRRPIPRHETLPLLQNVKYPTNWDHSQISTTQDISFLAIRPPHYADWHTSIKDRFPDISHEGATDTLNAFFNSRNSGLRKYESERSRADKELATSRLSVHLRLGTLSPNQLYWKTQDDPMEASKKKTFSRRLIWRDLAYYQLRCFPSMSSNAIRAHYQNTEWVSGEEEHRRLEAWKQGKTGYPIVDAGMRELYKTGWMTQTIRMVVASFLVEYLRVNWIKGCEFFHYTLVDADSAINAMMWQNAGKCGIDQWNFVLSPETASQDPLGNYTRRWVPELSKLPSGLCHRPWQASTEILQEAGVVLGKTYPHRIVTNLKQERALSIENTLSMRRKSQEFNDDRGYDVIVLPNGERTVLFTKKEYRIDDLGYLIDHKATPHQIKTKKKARASRRGRGKRTR